MTITRKLAAAATALAAAAPALAHDGHGLIGTHWHATDALGFAAVIAIGAIAIWASRK